MVRELGLSKIHHKELSKLNFGCLQFVFAYLFFAHVLLFYYLFFTYLFQFPGGLPPGMPGLPPAGPPRLDLPASLGGSLPPPRGSDPLMSLGPSAAPPSASHNSGPGGLRAPNSNDKVIRPR